MKKYLHSGVVGPSNRTYGWKWGVFWSALALAWLGMLVLFATTVGGWAVLIAAVFALVPALRAWGAFTGRPNAADTSSKGVLDVPAAAENVHRAPPTRFPTAASAPPIPPAEGPATAKAKRRPIQYSYRATSTSVTGAPPTNETEMGVPHAARAPTAGKPEDAIPVAVIEVPRLQVPQLGDDGRELRDPQTGQVVLGPWVFRVRGLSREELDNADRRSLVKHVDRRTGRNRWVADVSARASWIIYLATVPEDRQKPGGWDDHSMWAKFGVSSGVEVIDRVLHPGEKNVVLGGISQLSGINVG